MSNLVETLVNSFETTVATAVGAGWNELDYKYAVEKNNFLGNTQRYGVIPQGGINTTGVTRVYTIDHDFELILTTDYNCLNESDENQRTAVFLLYEKLDDIIKDVFNTKLSASSILLNVSAYTVSEPEFLDEKVVVLRTLFTLKYRNALS